MIEYLKWDSETFGFKTGRCFATESTDVALVLKQAHAEYYTLVYIYTSDTYTGEVIQKGLRITPIETKVLYSCPVKDLRALDILPAMHELNIVTPELASLARQSGECSRYNIDPLMPSFVFTSLYDTWIIKSVSKEIASHVWGYKEQNLVKGFVTYSCKEGIAHIGLIATDHSCRGKGVGKALVQTAINQAIKDGANEMQIVTQKNNVPAARLYESCGFFISTETSVFHYWPLR